MSTEHLCVPAATVYQIEKDVQVWSNETDRRRPEINKWVSQLSVVT